jgi:large subunit ribosomal protein L23
MSAAPRKTAAKTSQEPAGKAAPSSRVDPHDILIAPLLTEKSTRLRDQHNQIAFVVSSRANKSEVKKAVEEALKVKVDSVNIVNVRGKNKRLGRFEGRQSSWKKGIVTLKEGQKLDLFEGG